MSIDWSNRQNALGPHRHVRSQVVDDVTAESSGGFFAQEIDPGAVGPGAWWWDPASLRMRRRNSANTGWDAEGVITVQATGASPADVTATAIAATGTANAGSLASRSGSHAGMTAVVDSTSARMGFFGATEVAKPTVTGSRVANPALGSVLTALANLGLIIDNSS